MKDHGGYSLAELMISMAILSILLIMGNQTFAHFREKSIVSRIDYELASRIAILESLKIVNGNYPVTGKANSDNWGWMSNDPNNVYYKVPAPDDDPDLRSVWSDLPPNPAVDSFGTICSFPGWPAGQPGSAGFVYYSDGYDYKLMAQCAHNTLTPNTRYPDPLRSSINLCGVPWPPEAYVVSAMSIYSPEGRCF
jgi:prepilin-type N-terminal cleavage/methylation domain-containing protein